MATMLLAGSFRRVKKKEKNYDKCNGETGYFRDAQAEARVHRHIIGLSLFGVGEWVGGVVVLVG